MAYFYNQNGPLIFLVIKPVHRLYRRVAPVSNNHNGEKYMHKTWGNSSWRSHRVLTINGLLKLAVRNTVLLFLINQLRDQRIYELGKVHLLAPWIIITSTTDYERALSQKSNDFAPKSKLILNKFIVRLFSDKHHRTLFSKNIAN